MFWGNWDIVFFSYYCKVFDILKGKFYKVIRWLGIKNVSIIFIKKVGFCGKKYFVKILVVISNLFN